jgi:hypothetical protein
MHVVKQGRPWKQESPRVAWSAAETLVVDQLCGNEIGTVVSISASIEPVGVASIHQFVRVF